MRKLNSFLVAPLACCESRLK